jgi:hypothetical protein
MAAQSTIPVPLILLFTAIGFIVGSLVVYLVMMNEGRKTPSAGGPDPLQERRNRFQEIASLWRERAGSRLVVWLEDKMVDNPQTLDAGERQRLESAGRELLAWLGVQPAEKPAAEIAPAPQPAEIAWKPAPSPVPIAPAANPKIPPQPVSIVEQVNDILMEMIAGTPLEARLIHLAEDPRQGVVVWVGRDHYNGVDMVPDPEIKAMLRKAGAEWERRLDPKLRH